MDKNEEQKTYTIGKDWDWEKISEVWERVASLGDHYRVTEIPINAVSRGILLSAFQLFVLENGGNVALAKAEMEDTIQISGPLVSKAIIGSLKAAIEEGKVGDQSIPKADLERLRKDKENIEAAVQVSVDTKISEEDFTAAFSALRELSPVLESLNDKYGTEALTFAIMLAMEQSSLFAFQGDILSAKAYILNHVFFLWSAAIEQFKAYVNEAIDKVQKGPDEEKPN